MTTLGEGTEGTTADQKEKGKGEREREEERHIYGIIEGGFTCPQRARLLLCQLRLHLHYSGRWMYFYVSPLVQIQGHL